MSDTFSLVLPFDSDDPEFARGFDIGNVYGQLRAQPDRIEHALRAGNAEMLMRVAETAGYSYQAEPMGDTFLKVTLERQA